MYMHECVCVCVCVHKHTHARVHVSFEDHVLLCVALASLDFTW